MNKNSEKQAAKVRHTDTEWREQKKETIDQTIELVNFNINEWNIVNENLRLENIMTQKPV